MIQRFLVLLSVIALASCSSPRCEHSDAESLVSVLQPEAQLRAMLRMSVERTQTFRLANAKDSVGTRKRMDAALDQAVQKHSAEWERNLVNAWDTLNPAELEQVC